MGCPLLLPGYLRAAAWAARLRYRSTPDPQRIHNGSTTDPQGGSCTRRMTAGSPLRSIGGPKTRPAEKITRLTSSRQVPRRVEACGAVHRLRSPPGLHCFDAAIAVFAVSKVRMRTDHGICPLPRSMPLPAPPHHASCCVQSAVRIHHTSSHRVRCHRRFETNQKVRIPV